MSFLETLKELIPKVEYGGNAVTILLQNIERGINEKNLNMRWQFIDPEMRHHFEKLIYRNIDGQVKGSIMFHSDDELRASSIIENIVCEKNIFKEVVRTFVGGKEYAVLEEERDDFIKAIKTEYQKIYMNVIDSDMERVIKDALKTPSSLEYPSEPNMKLMDKIAQIISTQLNEPIKIKTEFQNLIEHCENANYFKVKDAEKENFLRSLKTSYKIANDNKNMPKNIIDSVKEILKSPLPIITETRPNIDMDIYASTIIKLIVCEKPKEKDPKSIKIKDKYGALVKISNDGNCFKVKESKRENFIEKIKEAYQNDIQEEIPEKLSIALENVVGNQFPLKSIVTKNIAEELAATSVVASIAFGGDDIRVGEMHFNIKREKYFGEKSKIFKDFIKIEDDGLTYTVKPDERQNFIQAIKEQYEAANYAMNPFIREAIGEVIKKPIPTAAGIPGLHAEVLAVNNEMNLLLTDMVSTFYKIFSKSEKKSETSKTSETSEMVKIVITEENITEAETQIKKLLSRHYYVYTHKFGSDQVKNLDISGVDQTQLKSFPACHNCSGILGQFCKFVHIRTLN